MEINEIISSMNAQATIDVKYSTFRSKFVCNLFKENPEDEYNG